MMTRGQKEAATPPHGGSLPQSIKSHAVGFPNYFPGEPYIGGGELIQNLNLGGGDIMDFILHTHTRNRTHFASRVVTDARKED